MLELELVSAHTLPGRICAVHKLHSIIYRTMIMIPRMTPVLDAINRESIKSQFASSQLVRPRLQAHEGRQHVLVPE